MSVENIPGENQKLIPISKAHNEISEPREVVHPSSEQSLPAAACSYTEEEFHHVTSHREIDSYAKESCLNFY